MAPSGEPYYLARIMEFGPDDMNDDFAPVAPTLPKWFYRPQDIQRDSTEL